MVDYVILSPSLFPYISEFKVLPFDPMTSNGHCGLHFSLMPRFTFAFRRVYDVRTMSKSPFPYGDLAIIVRIYGHRGLCDFV